MNEDDDSTAIPEADIHVVFVCPEIHGNTGNSGRTCLATGAQLHLVEPLGFSLDDRRVRRAGLDYWQRVRPQVWPDWPTFEEEMPSYGEPFFFTSEAPCELWEVEFPRRSVLVFGRESVGLDEGIREKYADRRVRIPMLDPGIRSLNLSNAVAIVLYEVLRQRQACLPRP
jgi:tRNA (cytidine/uridine-2'-O-)-methyltransferase